MAECRRVRVRVRVVGWIKIVLAGELGSLGPGVPSSVVVQSIMQWINRRPTCTGQTFQTTTHHYLPTINTPLVKRGQKNIDIKNQNGGKQFMDGPLSNLFSFTRSSDSSYFSIIAILPSDFVLVLSKMLTISFV